MLFVEDTKKLDLDRFVFFSHAPGKVVPDYLGTLSKRLVGNYV